MNLRIILANTLEVLEAQRAGIKVFICTPPSASSLGAGMPCAVFLASDTKGSLLGPWSQGVSAHLQSVNYRSETLQITERPRTKVLGLNTKSKPRRRLD